MKKWLQTVFRGSTLLAAFVAALATGVSIRLAPAEGEGPGSVVYQGGSAAAPEEGANITAVEVGRHGTASVHHLRIAEGVRAHVHRQHDEQVVVLGGEGTMKVGEATHAVTAGTVLLIPRGAVHQLTVTGPPVEAVSIFSPPFDGEDRHFVE